MKKLFITLMLIVTMAPMAMADMSKSEDGSLAIDVNHNPKVSCLWYLGNYRYLFDFWSDKVNDVIADRIEDIR